MLLNFLKPNKETKTWSSFKTIFFLPLHAKERFYLSDAFTYQALNLRWTARWNCFTKQDNLDEVVFQQLAFHAIESSRNIWNPIYHTKGWSTIDFGFPSSDQLLKTMMHSISEVKAMITSEIRTLQCRCGVVVELHLQSKFREGYPQWYIYIMRVNELTNLEWSQYENDEQRLEGPTK